MHLIATVRNAQLDELLGYLSGISSAALKSAGLDSYFVLLTLFCLSLDDK